MSALRCSACGHRILLSASTIACENCGMPLPFSDVEQELPPLPSSPGASNTAMQTQPLVVELSEDMDELSELDDECDPFEDMLFDSDSGVLPNQTTPPILRTAPSSSQKRPCQGQATRALRSYSSNLPVRSSKTALARSHPTVSLNTNRSPRLSDVFVAQKYPFWFPRRPPDMVGSIIHIQSLEEHSSMAWSFLQRASDAIWVTRSDSHASIKHDQMHITLLRLRLSNGTQKDARLEGSLIGAHLTLGDVLSLWGKQRHGVLLIRRAFNNTSGAVVSTRVNRSSPWPSLVLLILLLLALFIANYWYHISVLPDLTRWWGH